MFSVKSGRPYQICKDLEGYGVWRNPKAYKSSCVPDCKLLTYTCQYLHVTQLFIKSQKNLKLKKDKFNKMKTKIKNDLSLCLIQIQ